MTVLRFVLSLLFNAVASLFGLVFAVCHGVKVGLFVLRDMFRASRHLGGLRCPQGHRVDTAGGTYECTSCGWTFGLGKSIWRCDNPECRAITTAISCPTCGLSVRNPFRWGRG